MLTEEQVKKYESIYNSLTTQITDYLLKNNLKTMVLGISGGIDSTVCAALCNGAIEKADFKISLYGVMLPSVTNAMVENESAVEVMQAFCPMHNISFIDDAVNALEDLCGNVPAESTKLAIGNIKARTRMIYLYHAAQLLKGVVIDSDNFSEAMLSFYTLHGDVGDLTPMSDLWKHEVYELAEYIKDYVCETDNQKHAIGLSMALTPTDGNDVLAGGDMAQIAPGYTYNEVDKILFLLDYYERNEPEKVKCAEWRKSIIEAVCYNMKDIMDAETIRKVCERHFKSAFKKHLPIRLHTNEQ